MDASQSPLFSVGDFVAITNQVLEQAYPSILIEGEVESFKVNQGKFVFFNLKDSEASVGCFMMVFALRTPIEDGMKVIVRARPKLTQWGKFSLTIESIRPSGEGSLKKSFELLKAKLTKEGLFAPERKRLLPHWPQRVAVISSMESAGYADFMKIANERMGGVEFVVHHTQVQGESAPQQIEQAIVRANEAEQPADVLVLIRGGGSADDLAAFNDEKLVRAIAASRIPTLVGVGHEVDVSLADMVADVRAATPSNAATILLPDRHETIARVQRMAHGLAPRMLQLVDDRQEYVAEQLERARDGMFDALDDASERTATLQQLLAPYNPHNVLARGYAIVRGSPAPGAQISIETAHNIITAKVEKNEQK